MVYALKSYNNNQPYRRAEDKNVLDMLIKKFSKEATNQYSVYPNEKKSFVDKSVQKENVVRQMAIKRVNKLLCVIISMLIAVVVVSYYFVITCEIKLDDLRRQTVILNNENTDLQNKLDTLKSFSNVDKTFQQNKMLKRAGQVIEIPEVTVDSSEVVSKKTKRRIFNHAIGF